MTRTPASMPARGLLLLAGAVALLLAAGSAQGWTGSDPGWYNAKDNRDGPDTGSDPDSSIVNRYSDLLAMPGATCPAGANQYSGYPNIYGAITPSFNFQFYDYTITALRLQSYGGISFVTGGAGQYSGIVDPIPDWPTPEEIVPVFWNDLEPTAGQVCYKVVTVNGERLFIATWDGVLEWPANGGEPATNAALVLYEDSGLIEFHYGDSQTSRDSSAGIETGRDPATGGYQNPVHGIQYIYEADRNGEAVQFRPVDTYVTAEDDAFAFDYGVEGPTFTVEPACTSASKGVLCNDGQLGNVVLSAVLETGPSPGGALTLRDNGTFVFTPPAADPCNDANGGAPFTFTYRADDAWPDHPTGLDVATVSITVTNCNDPPVANDESYNGAEDTVLSDYTLCSPKNYYGVLCNDTDDDKPIDELSAELMTPPQHAAPGGFQLFPNGSFEYLPKLHWSGTDSFTYRAYDGNKYSQNATVTITIAPRNDAPDWKPGPDIVLNEDNAPSGTVPVVKSNWATGVTAGGGAFEDPDVVTFNVTWTGPAGLLTDAPTIERVDATERATISFAPGTDLSGTALVTAHTWDGITEGPARTFNITIRPSNDAPVFTAGPALSFPEGSGIITHEDWATGIGPGGGDDEHWQTVSFKPTHTATIFQAGPSWTVTGTTARLEVAAKAEACSPDPVPVTLTLRDNGGTANGGVDESAATVVDIEVRCINDEPSFQAGPSQQVYEDYAEGAITVPGWATDVSTGGGIYEAELQTLRFEIAVDADHQALFLQGPSVRHEANGTGTLQYTLAPDACSDTPALVNVTLFDSGPHGTDAMGDVHDNRTEPQSFTIDVPCRNDAPRFDTTGDIVIDEDTGSHELQWATDLAPGGPEESGQAITWDALPGDVLFTTTPSLDLDGTIQFEVRPEYCGTYETQAILRDDGPAGEGHENAQSKTLRIVVRCINDAPTLTSVAPIVLAEDAGNVEAAPGTWVDSTVGPEPEPQTQSVAAYQVLHDAPPGFFALEPAFSPDGRGTLTVAADQCGDVTLTVRVQDDGGMPGTDTSEPVDVPLSVACVNDPPVVVTPDALVVPEDAGPVETPLVVVATTGPSNEAHQTLTGPTLEVEDVSMFDVPPALEPDGNVSFTASPDACGTTILRLTAHDDGGGDDTTVREVPLQVTCINDAPSGKVGELVYLEDESPATITVPGFVSEIDQGGGSYEDHQQVGFSVAFDGEGLLLDPVVDASGTLTFQLARDRCGNQRGTLTVFDDGRTEHGGVDRVERPFGIMVRCVNDAPTFQPGAPVQIFMDAVPELLEVPAWATKISPGAPQEAYQKTWFTVTTVDPSKFTVLEVQPDGMLRLKPAEGELGTMVATVCIMDDGGTLNGGDDTGPCHDLVIHLLDRNDPPTFLPGPDITVLEDSEPYAATWATEVSAGPEEDQGLAFAVQSPGGWFSDGPRLVMQPAVGDDNHMARLEFTPARDASGTVAVTVRLTDDGGTAGGGVDTSGPVVFTITMEPTPDPPTAYPDAYSLAEETTLQLPAPGVLANDIDPDGDALTVRLVSGPDIGDAALAPDGSLTYAPPKDFAGDAVLVYEVRDGTGRSSTSTVTLEVTDVNDLPVGVEDYYAIRPGMRNHFDAAEGLTANDVDQDGDVLDVLIFGLSAVDDRDGTYRTQHGVLTIHAAGAFSYTPDEQHPGVDDFTYRAEDPNGGRSAPTIVRLRLAENADPVARFVPTVTETVVGHAIGFADESYDPDAQRIGQMDTPNNATGLASWQWDFGDGTTSSKQHPVHTYQDAGSYIVRLTVRDREGAHDTLEVPIEVLQASRLADGEAPRERPVVTAGDDRYVHAGEAVRLEATLEQGTATRYAWLQTDGARVEILHPDEPLAYLNVPAPVPGAWMHTMTFQVRAFDGIQWSEPDAVLVHVYATGVDPRLVVEDRREAQVGDPVELRAEYEGFPEQPQQSWRQVAGPAVGILGTPGEGVRFIVPPHAANSTLVFEVTAHMDGLSAAPALVQVEVPPAASDVLVQATRQADGSYVFTAPTQGDHTWDFGDGTEAQGTSVVHKYARPGTYEVRLHAEAGHVSSTQVWVPEPVQETQSSVPPFLAENAGAIALGLLAFVVLGAIVGVALTRKD